MRLLCDRFGEVAENHVGMQKIGAMAERGLSITDLKTAKERFEKEGCHCELVDLGQVDNLFIPRLILIKLSLLSYSSHHHHNCYFCCCSCDSVASFCC